MKSSQGNLSKTEIKLVFLAILVTLITPFASDAYTPSLPAITRAFQSTSDSLQYTMTFFLLSVALSQLVYGPLSDRYGRRPIILLGVMLALLGTILCALAFSVLTLILARSIQGAGVGVSNSLYRALLRDKFTGTKMSVASSYSGMSYTVGFALAPVLGGYIQHYFDWRAVFIFVAFVIFTIFITLYKYLTETHMVRDRSATKFKNILWNYSRLLCSFNFVGYAVISGLSFSGIIAYYTAAPFLMQNVLHLSPITFGWLSIGLAAGIFAGQYINARLVIPLGVTFLLLVGLCIMLVSSFVMLVCGLLGILNVYVIIVPVVIFCIASGLVYTNAMANSFRTIKQNVVGIAGAMYGCIQILITSITSVVVSIVPESSQIPLASIFTGLVVAALALFCILGMYSRYCGTDEE